MTNATTYVRRELQRVLPDYESIYDCLMGQRRVKEQATKYLPQPNPQDTSRANQLRYRSYLERAAFYNVTQRTQNGLHGQIFMRNPIMQMPSSMRFLMRDATGSGVGLAQLAKEGASTVISYGRAGIFVDYPAVEGPVSLREIQSGAVRPSLHFYNPWDIVNWRTRSNGAQEILTLVILRERMDFEESEFSTRTYYRWRVLSLDDDNTYRVRVFNSNIDVYNSLGVEPYKFALAKHTAFSTVDFAEENFVPLDASGNPFNRIPFFFVGSENNDSRIDNPPLLDIADLNIAHYRNSADYEESSFIAGQPTPVITGLDQTWVTEVLEGGNSVYLGSRSAIMLPMNASAELLQADSNSQPFEAMQHKERQMIALGAKLVEQSGVERTASEATINFTTETSILASVAKNVTAALQDALDVVGQFLGISSEDAVFELNTDFDIANMSPEALRQTIETWQAGGLTWSEMRKNLRNAGLASLEDAEAQQEIQTDSVVQRNNQNGGSDNAQT